MKKIGIVFIVCCLLSCGASKSDSELPGKRALKGTWEVTDINFIGEEGIAANRLTKEGLGQTMPRFDNNTVEGRSKNRRVEIAVTANQQMIVDARSKSN